MNGTISALVWCAVQVTALSCGAAIVYLAARRLHPRAGAAAAGGGLMMVIALTALMWSPWPRWRFESGPTNSAAIAAATLDTHAKQAGADSGSPAIAAANAIPAVVAEPSLWSRLVDAIGQQADGTIAANAGDGERAVGWPPLIAILFVGGALVSAARLMWGVVCVRKLARSGRVVDDSRVRAIVQELQARLEMSGELAVREADDLSTPATIGWRCPAVLLPATWREWNDAELRAVIAHELAHIAGRDFAAWFVARLAVVAHFYHPLVRWLAGRLQLEQELAADMTAARALGDAKQYLHSLAALALAMPANRMTGPARTLFPSRSLLVRRVEMLRTNGVNRRRSRGARYVVYVMVAVLGLAAAGLRGPGIGFATSALAQSPGAGAGGVAKTEAAPRLGLEFVPPDAIYVLSVRVAELAARKDIGPLVRYLAEASEEIPAPADIAEVMFVPYGSLQGPQNVRIVLRFTSPTAQVRFGEWLVKVQQFESVTEPKSWTSKNGGKMIALDDTTIAGDIQHGGGPTGAAMEPAPWKNAPPQWAAAWQARDKEPILLAAELGTRVRQMLQAAGAQGNELRTNPMYAPLMPLIMDVNWAIAGMSFSDAVAIQATLQSDDEKSAANVRDTLKAVAVLFQNAVDNKATFMRPLPDGSMHPDAAFYLRFVDDLRDMLKNAEFKTEGKQVQVSMRSTNSPAKIAKRLQSALPSVEQARAGARQAVNQNNLKQLALGMLIYEDAHKSYPQAAGYAYRAGGETRTSKYPHSWRLDLLPYLERQPLYDQYHFDEPWDSEANQKVTAQIPAIFRSPFDPDPKSTNTSYFCFTGEPTMFPEKSAVKIRQVTDGTSRTILLVEAKRPVPWTKPEDIPYAADVPVPKLEGWQPGQVAVAMCDGSVRPVDSDIVEVTLRAFITRSGGEPVGELPAPKDGGR